MRSWYFSKNLRDWRGCRPSSPRRAPSSTTVLGKRSRFSDTRARFSASLPTCRTTNCVFGWRANTRLRAARSSSLLGKSRPWKDQSGGFEEGHEAPGGRPLEVADRLLQAGAGAAREVHHRLDVLAVHHLEQLGGGGQELHILAAEDAAPALRGPGEVRVDVDDGEARA